MKYRPGFKFTINSNSSTGTIWDKNKKKGFIKSPIEKLDLDKEYKIYTIKPIYEDNKLKHLKYTFISPNRQRNLIERRVVFFNSAKEADDILDLITGVEKTNDENEQVQSMSLKDRLANRPRIDISAQRRNRNRRGR